MTRNRSPRTHTSSHAAIAMMTATHCCVCKAQLTDAESVEIGLGPICSRRYYNPTHQPSIEDVRNALGLLAISGLPDRIVEEFIRVVNNDHANARLGCNILVYWSSCNYQNRDEVFKCSSIVRALGYKELADKLETDRTVATLRFTPAGDYIEFFAPDPYSFHKDLMRIPGIEYLQDSEGTPTGQSTGTQAKMGHKFGWRVHTSQEALLECILGIHYGGELACNEKGVFTIPRHRRYELEGFLNPMSKVPTAASQGIYLSLTPSGHRLTIQTPFMTAFKEELKQVIPWNQRTWTGSRWEVDLRHKVTIEEMVKRHFGVKL